jgi:hypothetical protein
MEIKITLEGQEFPLAGVQRQDPNSGQSKEEEMERGWEMPVLFREWISWSFDV